MLAGRLYQLQILEHDQFAARSVDNRVKLQLLVPERGRMFDRQGVLIAGNRWHHYLHVEPPDDASSRRRMLLQLSQILKPTRERFDQLAGIFESNADGARDAHSLVRLESWEDVTRIASHSVILPGVAVQRESERYYPCGADLAHLLGYVSSATKEDVEENAVLANLANYQIGRVGFERTLEPSLRGRIGTRHVEVNARGKPVRNLRERKALPGKDLHLTVDCRLQQFAAERLAGETGAAVVLDASNGDALACCSSPSFDPNLFVSGLDPAAWKSLSTDPLTPLVDRALRGQYAPGSTFKLVVALAALEAGHDPDSSVFCTGVREVGDHRFHCWRRHGHGSVAFKQAIAQSCDVYFYDLALTLGVDAIASMARRLGLGSPVAEHAAIHERDGIVPTREWKQRAHNRSWRQSDTANIGIGQGYLLSTPLQLALMVARIASGRELAVRFIREEVSPGAVVSAGADTWPIDFAVNQSAGALDIDAVSLAMVRDAMIAAVNAPEGTARPARIEQPDYQMAGKTGTVQVRRITAEERETGIRKNEDLPWNVRDHALFVGYAPLERPRHAVAVVVEHGGSGSRVAAPIARDLLLEAERLRGPVADPDGDHIT